MRSLSSFLNDLPDVRPRKARTLILESDLLSKDERADIRWRDSSWITFGGHTHTHPVLARCTAAQQQREIETCRDRMTAELGAAPRLFAFPNGRAQDYSAETLHFLQEAGFELAWTMVNERTSHRCQALEMPRYGSPASVWETEATVSGAFELTKEWRQRCLRALGGVK